ncbi:DUF3817 domain-containing protein [Demequina capsici]|uniref:DUF3817 domain-containing protein n=1 Tax=Demequina capsici TaxID=3075620 RepID=A0AA96FC90_9MICO|nr:DUF3817 domain-containing protein [Demequina sp. PMTSA13]WNM26807.1 DUF3817 domain-containing protein [Demequina sp. PMTSA13]
MTDPAVEPTAEASGAGMDPRLAGDLRRYKVMAIITGTLLLTVFLGLIRYAFGLTDGPVDTFFTAVAIVHGWVFMVYLVTVVMLWMRMRWSIPRLIYMAAGGVVPTLSFFAERRIAREVAGSVNP